MSSPALPVKARHYQHLAARLAALTATADAARATVETAAHQSLVISELAAFQASMCVDADASCRCAATAVVAPLLLLLLLLTLTRAPPLHSQVHGLPGPGRRGRCYVCNS